MRDSRRRRLMFRDDSSSVEKTDDHDTATVDGQTEQTATKPLSQRYTSGVLVENQPKLIDYVPKRTYMIVGVFLMLVAVVALLNIAHFKIMPIANLSGIDATSLNMTLDQGLLSWVSSFLLLASAFFCFQVYQVRKYRADDYSGSYRVWVWLSAGFVIASIDATARLSPIAASLIASNWETGVLANDQAIWMMLIGVPASLVCVRLSVELWRSRIALGSIVIAGVTYLFANLIRFDLLPESVTSSPVVESNSFLLANCSAFFTVVYYARYVLLESQALPHVAAKMSEEQITKEESGEDSGKGRRKSKRASLRVSRESVEQVETESDATSDSSATESGSEEDADTQLLGQQIHQMPNKRKRKAAKSTSRRRAA